jgi:hypothetical protein
MTRLPWRRFERDQDVWEIELDGPICRTRAEDASSNEAAVARYVEMIDENLWEAYEIVSPGKPAPIMPLLPGDPNAELARLIDQAGLSAKRAAIEATVNPALRVRLRRVAEEDLPVGQVWCDADLLYYWITPAALKAKSFDAVTSNYAD